MSSKPVVSIGLPVYNGAEFLSYALQSLLEQSFEDIEIIVSDNASTDATRAVVKDFCKKNPCISYFRHEKNVGAVANFEFVLKQATGEYFMWAACDDVWDPLWVETLLSGFSEKSVVLSFGKLLVMNESGVVIRDSNTFSFSENRLIRLVKYFWMEEYSGKACLVYGLFRTNFLLNRKSFADFNAGNYSDMLFVFNCINYGSVYINSSVVFYKRIPPSKGGQTPFIARIWNSVFLIGQINYYVGYIKESNHLVDKLVIVSLLPFKYAKGFLFKIIRVITR